MLFAVMLFASCGNKKVELVNLEIRLKDSLERANTIWQQQAADLTLPVSEGVARDQANALRVVHLKRSIDSIEMELKKY